MSCWNTRETVRDGTVKASGRCDAGEILLSFSGRYCVTVENYRGILLFEGELHPASGEKLQAADLRTQTKHRVL